MNPFISNGQLTQSQSSMPTLAITDPVQNTFDALKLYEEKMGQKCTKLVLNNQFKAILENCPEIKTLIEGAGTLTPELTAEFFGLDEVQFIPDLPGEPHVQ